MIVVEPVKDMQDVFGFLQRMHAEVISKEAAQV
jgi:hypothetical protein